MGLHPQRQESDWYLIMAPYDTVSYVCDWLCAIRPSEKLQSGCCPSRCLVCPRRSTLCSVFIGLMNPLAFHWGITALVTTSPQTNIHKHMPGLSVGTSKREDAWKGTDVGGGVAAAISKGSRIGPHQQDRVWPPGIGTFVPVATSDPGRVGAIWVTAINM